MNDAETTKTNKDRPAFQREIEALSTLEQVSATLDAIFESHASELAPESIPATRGMRLRAVIPSGNDPEDAGTTHCAGVARTEASGYLLYIAEEYYPYAQPTLRRSYEFLPAASESYRLSVETIKGDRYREPDQPGKQQANHFLRVAQEFFWAAHSNAYELSRGWDEGYYFEHPYFQ